MNARSHELTVLIFEKFSDFLNVLVNVILFEVLLLELKLTFALKKLYNFDDHKKSWI